MTENDASTAVVSEGAAGPHRYRECQCGPQSEGERYARDEAQDPPDALYEDCTDEG